MTNPRPPYDKGPGLMLNIHISTVSHDLQRYATVGDWQEYMGNAQVSVSRMSNPKYEQLVALHEIVEMLLCTWCGISTGDVDLWDTKIWYGEGEPGDDPKAPYHKQHMVASVVERLAAELLGVDWNEYTREVDELCDSTQTG